MGVFHMAIPFAMPATRPAFRPAPRPCAVNRDRDAAPLNPGQSVPSTLLPSHSLGKSPEGRVQRTPQQQAEWDAQNQAQVRLVAQCMAGDQRAWHQMVTGQHKRVYAICYRFTGDPTEAEDITQDVFLKIYRNLSSFDPEKGAFGTWITTLTRNMLVDNYRRTKLDRATDSMDVSMSGEDDGPTMAAHLADTRPGQEQNSAGLELKATIQQALKKLSPELRE